MTPGNRGGRPDGASADGAAPRPVVRQGSRLALRNWRVRWRLIAIIVVPTVAALIFGAVQIAGSVNNYTSFKRVQTLANLNALVVTAVGQLADERDATAGYVAAGKPAAMKNTVTQDQQATDATLNQISAQAAAVGSGYRAQTVLDLQNGVLSAIADLRQIRTASLNTRYQPLAIIQSYDSRIAAFDRFSNDVSAGTGNDTLQSDVAVLNALLRMEDDASLQRADLYQALLGGQGLTPFALSNLNQAQAQQQADLSQFNAVASVAESQTFSNTVSGQQVDEAESEEALAIALTNRGQALSIGAQQTCAGQTNAACWWNTQSNQIQLMRQVSNGPTGLVAQITAQANSLTSSALRSAIIVSAATLLLLIIVLLITTFVARSMIRPLRKLRADALEVAGSKLPDMVRRLSESQGSDESIEIEPIGVTSTDEIGEVARAFDQVHREAVRLAADEAMLRGNLNAMFVNLSRRSQSLIERQLSLIDNLEQTEQDPDRLSSLFRLDHMATRMRRNSENLLVLAGHEAASRRWSQPVPLVDVLRAAISEIEQYERVVLNVQPGIQVIGQAVNDVVHLVAEIVENATTFSPEETQVYVTGQPLTSGGVLLDITDNGVGISEQEMAHANWRLDNPPVVDVAVSRRMGLFVVGRLAARHGIRVRLRHAQSGGLTALIWLPESVATPEGAQPLGGRLRKFEADDFGPAPSLSAPPQPSAGAGGFGLPAAPGSAAAQAAAAARIPRFSGSGPRTAGDPVFGAGVGPGGGPGPGGGTGPNGVVSPGGSTGQDSPLPARDSSLPARQPSNNLQSSPDGGKGSVFRPGSTPPDLPSTEFDSPGFAPRGPGSASGAGASATNGVSGTNGIGGPDGSQVTIPPAASPARDQRLPIFDSLESDWFRRSGKPLSSAGGSGTTASEGGQSWNSPADEGWRAAKVVASPAAGETTTAGLPKRVPRANLVPGSVGGGEDTEAAPPVRSADTIRDRMASFQRGVREARTAAPQIEEP